MSSPPPIIARFFATPPEGGGLLILDRGFSVPVVNIHVEDRAYGEEIAEAIKRAGENLKKRQKEKANA